MKNTFKNLVFLLTMTIVMNYSSGLMAQRTFVNKEWVNNTGTVGSVSRTVSAIDTNMNVIVVSNTIVSSNNTDVLITKYDSAGELVWQQTFNAEGNGNDYGIQVKIGDDNSIYRCSISRYIKH